MSLKDWWGGIRELFEKPKPPESEKPPFLPPHSWPDGKPLPPWPEKKDRQ